METVPKSTRKPPVATRSRKGVPNKNTAAIKDMILNALEGVGGVDYLMDCARDDKSRSAFLTLVGKVLPLQVTGADGGAIQTVTRVELVNL